MTIRGCERDCLHGNVSRDDLRSKEAMGAKSESKTGGTYPAWRLSVPISGQVMANQKSPKKPPTFGS
jgi:hypothetical protein